MALVVVALDGSTSDPAGGHKKEHRSQDRWYNEEEEEDTELLMSSHCTTATTTTMMMRLSSPSSEAGAASSDHGTAYYKYKKYCTTSYDDADNNNCDDNTATTALLPPEVLRHITGYVNDPRTAGRLAQTNQAWSNVVTHHATLWHNLAQARWKLHPIRLDNNDSTNDNNDSNDTALQFRQHYVRRHISDHRVRVLLQTLVRQMLSLHYQQGSSNHDSNNNNSDQAAAFGLVYGWHWGSSFWRRLVEGLLQQHHEPPDGHCFAQALDVVRDMARPPPPQSTQDNNEADEEEETVPAARLLLPRLTRCVATHVLDTLHTAQIQSEWRQRVLRSQQQGNINHHNDHQLLEEGAILLARSLVPPAALVHNNDNEEDRAFGLGPSIVRQLDEWAAQLQKRLNDNHHHNHNALTAVQTLTQLFGLQGCSTDDYYNVRHSSLASVLQTRRGIPITLAVVYKLVLWRCGFDNVISIVGLPGHVVLGCGAANGGAAGGEEPTHFVDVFHGGRVLTVRDCMDLVLLRGFPWSRSFLQPLSACAVLRRMLNNLQHCLGREFHRRPQRRVRTVIQLERTQQLQLALQQQQQQPEASSSTLDDGGEACPELTLDPDIFFQHGLIDAATAERCHQASIARAFQEP